MVSSRMSGLAGRQSVTNRRRQPFCASASTRLWPGARSAMVAPCRANGAQTSVGTPSAAREKSRSSRWSTHFEPLAWLAADQANLGGSARASETLSTRATSLACIASASPAAASAMKGQAK